MREKTVEQALMKEIRKRGGICEKWTSGTSGWPDRIVLFPGEKIAFIEVKAPGKRPRPLQRHRHRQLEEMGFKVYVLDDLNKIGGILDGIQTT